ncbi:MAG: helix-turn-helix transcriptional regulator [Bacteroidota bacterium]
MDSEVKRRMELLEEFIRSGGGDSSRDSIDAESLYSFRHSNRLFKKLKGESIKSYSNKIRLQLAADYLKHTSVDITQIGLEVGYETSASFSKAFKKLYGESPSVFRSKNNLRYYLKEHHEGFFKVEFFDKVEIQLRRISFSTEGGIDELSIKAQHIVEESVSSLENWLLIWDEDPLLTMTEETRCFLGGEMNESGLTDNSENTMVLDGKYAIFQADSFGEFEYENWHELAYLILETAGKKYRELSYLEWFNTDVFSKEKPFQPYKIGVPIR